MDVHVIISGEGIKERERMEGCEGKETQREKRLKKKNP